MAINLLFLIFVAAIIVNAAFGLKRGAVKKLISTVTLLIMSLVIVLAGNGINGYLSGKVINVIIAVILLIILAIVQIALSMLFLPLKILSKLPIVSWADKLLGFVFAIFQIFVALWTIYGLMMVLDLGNVGNWIWTCTQENQIMGFLYDHNLLVNLLKNVAGKIQVPTTYTIL